MGTGTSPKPRGEKFTDNGAQQLTSSAKDGVTTRYEYAGADMNKLLSQSTDGGSEYNYTYGRALTSRTVGGTGTASVISDPVTGQALDLQTSDGVTSMWVVDGLGSPNAAITDAGAKAYEVHYDPYGTERITAGDRASVQWQQNTYGFKTGLRSSNTDNGLTKFGYRWQTSATGGWIERDTLDSPLSPTNANRYAFAGDDPVNNSDPSGRSVIEVIAEILEAVAYGRDVGEVVLGMTSAERLSFLGGAVFAGGCYLSALALGVATEGAAGVPAVLFCALVGETASYAYDRLYG